MAHQYRGHSESHTVKMTKNNLDSQDIRVILSNYILNFEFPRDVYTILIAIFTIYIALKVFRFSIGLLASVVRPILLIILILIIVPYIYEMRSGITSNATFSKAFTHTEGFVQSIFGTLHSIYKHTIQFYAKNFVM